MTFLYKYSNLELSFKGFDTYPFKINKGENRDFFKNEQSFKKLGNYIKVAFEDLRTLIITKIIEPADRFFKLKRNFLDFIDIVIEMIKSYINYDEY